MHKCSSAEMASMVLILKSTSNGLSGDQLARGQVLSRELTLRRTPWYCVAMVPMSIANGLRAKKPASCSSSALNPGGSYSSAHHSLPLGPTR